MKRYLNLAFTLAVLVMLTNSIAMAENDEKMVIALKTDHFELTETDISNLAVGEAKTIETGSGKIIDVIRTDDGAEIYIDGELLEMDFDHEGMREEHMIRKHVEIICDEGQDCEKQVELHSLDEADISKWMTEDGDHIVIHKEVELVCEDDESDTSCSGGTEWVTDGEDIDIEKLHEMHADGHAQKVIIIKKEIKSKD